MYEVITVGSATIDVFAKADSELIKIKTPSSEQDLLAYPVGSKILISKISFFTGGGGTNTAVGFSRLGCKTAFLGKLGRDSNALKVLHMLRKEHVDFIGVQGDRMTGYSIILDSLEKDRVILTYKGANDTLGWKDVDKKLLKTEWFYFSSMMEESFLTIQRLAVYAKEHGIKVAFNPSSYLCKKGMAYIADILNRTDIIVLNKEEATYLTHKVQMKDQLKALRAAGIGIVVVTNGKKLVGAFDGAHFYYIKPAKVRPVETAGAGDALASGFVGSLIKGKSIDWALKVGVANSQSVVQHVGTKNILLTMRQAMADSRKRKYVVRKVKA
jgi:ribokinase